MMSVKPRHLLLLFYKIFVPMFVFLPALQNLKNASSPFQFLATSLARLPGLPRQSCSGDLSGDFIRARKSGSLRGPNPKCRVDGKAVSSCFVFLCTRKQIGNPTGKNFPIFKNIHHLLDHMVPHSKLCCSFSDCYPSFFSV
jgi:hypothetical protein